jgi:hypothetical protein
MWLAFLLAAAAQAADEDRLVVERHLMLGRTGVVMMGAGLAVGAVYPLAALAICSGERKDLGCAAYGLLVGIGVESAAAMITLAGESLMFAGGIGASVAQGRSPAMGVVGALLVGGGTLALARIIAEGERADEVAAAAGVGAVLVGTGLGCAQLANARGPLISLTPTLGGLQLAGRF